MKHLMLIASLSLALHGCGGNFAKEAVRDFCVPPGSPLSDDQVFETLWVGFKLIRDEGFSQADALAAGFAFCGNQLGCSACVARIVDTLY